MPTEPSSSSERPDPPFVEESQGSGDARDPAAAPQAPEALGAKLSRIFLGPPELIATAPVTRAVILSTMVVFVAQVLAVRRVQALVSMPEAATLLFGANYGPFVWYEHRVEVLLTAVFLHASLLHIGFNLYALPQVGPFVERVAGSARFALLYITSGVVGSLASAAQPFFYGGEKLSVGASGAICGLIGAAMVIGVRTEGWKSPISRSMGFWLFLTVAVGSKMNADNAAHIGGALFGAVMAATWRRGQTYTAKATAMIAAVCGALVILAFTAVAARDLLDPYASLTAGERGKAAVDAILSGDCENAKAAVAAAARLRAPHIEMLTRELPSICTQ